MDIYMPQKPGPHPLPIITFFYGGGWVRGHRDEFGFVGRALAARGYMVAMPNYRLAPKHRFPAFIEDGAAAMAW